MAQRVSPQEAGLGLVVSGLLGSGFWVSGCLRWPVLERVAAARQTTGKVNAASHTMMIDV